MRKPSEYVAAAKAHLRDSLIPDCSEVMRCGERTATVTRVGSPSRGGEPLMGGEPAESCRVLVMASDFPELARGDAVELGRSLRVVTSCHADIVGVGYIVGLSAEFEKCPAAYSGTRRKDGRVCQLRCPLDVLLLESGVDASYLDDVAPAMEKMYSVAIRRADWPEVSDPEVSDFVLASPYGKTALNMRVSAVARHDGWFILKCRTHGGRND